MSLSIADAAYRVEAGPAHVVSGMPDVADAPFLECALAANVPLVTGNVRHYPRSVARHIAVLTPARFVASVTE